VEEKMIVSHRCLVALLLLAPACGGDVTTDVDLDELPPPGELVERPSDSGAYVLASGIEVDDSGAAVLDPGVDADDTGQVGQRSDPSFVRPLVDFGGFFSKPAIGESFVATSNGLTGTLGCPSGYSATRTRGSPGLDVTLFVCTRPHIEGVTAEWAFGGMFGAGRIFCSAGRAQNLAGAAELDAFDHARCAHTSGGFPSSYDFNFVNVLTGARTCPSGFFQATAVATHARELGISYCYRSLTAGEQPSFLFGGAYGSGRRESDGTVVPARYPNPATAGLSCPPGYIDAWSSGTANVDYYHHYCVRNRREDRCGTSPLGTVQSRVRHREVVAAACVAEQQSRGCRTGGVWGAWSGTFSHSSCAIEPWDADAVTGVVPGFQYLTPASPHYRLPAFGVGRIRPILYRGAVYRGASTEVFAWLGLPEGSPPANGWPAVVCVHGGGGTAFSGFVNEWNARGFAAIAMDTYGGVPTLPAAMQAQCSLPTLTHTQRHGCDWAHQSVAMSNGGPGIGHLSTDFVANNAVPTVDHWMYQAVTNAVRAHSLLRQLPQVNADRIGITGISWGGIVAANAAGVDARLDFAVPVYGSGFLIEAASYMRDKFAPQPYWDPAFRLLDAAMPILWVSGASDPHFPLRSVSRSADFANGPQRLSIMPAMAHGHYEGMHREEIYRFAKGLYGGVAQLPQIVGLGHDGNAVTVGYWSPSAPAVVRAELVYTTGPLNCAGPACVWATRIVQGPFTNNRVVLTVPAGATGYFVNVVDAVGHRVSTSLQRVL
jgi:dienelactone hydrolase